MAKKLRKGAGKKASNRSGSDPQQHHLPENDKKGSVETTMEISVSSVASNPEIPTRKSTKVHPTSEQILIASLTTDSSEDPKQRIKIQRVMDITKKEEDVAATALHDSGWDENKAISLIFDPDSSTGAWEETGKRKKKKNENKSSNLAQASSSSNSTNSSNFTNSSNSNSLFKESVIQEERDDWNDEDDEINDGGSESKARAQLQLRGPPRLRRGGRGRDSKINHHNHNNSNNNNNNTSGGGLSVSNFNTSDNFHGEHEGGRGSRGLRRGFRGRSSHSSRNPADHRNSGGGVGAIGSGGGVGLLGSISSSGFSGSIETWNPSGVSTTTSTLTSTINDSLDPHEPSLRRSVKHGTSSTSTNSKDAFENAGNWGDDFPAAEDWDNEEYTGSLAESKVFTAKNQKSPGGREQSHPGVSSSSSPPGSGSRLLLPSSTVVYSTQSIDLSTLLTKPSTQSSTPLVQYTMHSGRGQNSSSHKASCDVPLHCSASVAPSSASVSSSVPGESSTVFGKGKASRLPPPSKIPSSAVEMPGDALSKLDVQFGVLDLQFGNSNDSGFELHGGSASSPTLGDSSSKVAMAPSDKYTSSAPSAKEVNKSLASISSSSKLSDFNKSSTLHQQQQQQQVHHQQQQQQALATNFVKNNTELYNYYCNYPPSKPYTNYNNSSQYFTSLNYNSSSSGGNSAGSGGNTTNNNHNSQNNYSPNYTTTNNNNYSNQNNTHSSSSYSKGGSVSSLNYDKQYDTVPNGGPSLGLTNTTNALSGKVSVTANGGASSGGGSSKVLQNLPHGVHNLLPPHHQYMLGNPTPAPLPAFYGLQQPIYSTYNSGHGMEELAALQRSAAGTSPYYDPTFAAPPNSTGLSRNGDSSTSSSLSHNSFSEKNTFGSSGSSESPSTAQAAALSVAAAAAAASQPFNFNTLAAAAAAAQQQSPFPPGYAYFYSPTLQAYGAAPPNVYPPGAMNVVPSGATAGSSSSQFQKNAYGSSYGGYDTGSKDFGSSYTNSSTTSAADTNGGGKAPGGSGGGVGVPPSVVTNTGSSSGSHQFWTDGKW